jgi:SAM-dependent methyltransferase
MQNIPEEQHNIEIQENLNHWQNKPVLQKIYSQFYQLISSQIDLSLNGRIVELGSGIGNLKTYVPQAICTDLFDNPWIDQVENAYKMSFEDASVSHLILFDVFHHLQYPGTAFNEFKRVLMPGGRVIIFDPAISFFGLFIYGLFHHEPIRLLKKIQWDYPEDGKLDEYYAAQGNASRVFYRKKYSRNLRDWRLISKKKMAALSYVASGGYSKKQMYKDSQLPFMFRLDKILDIFPALFATRLLAVLEKK